LNPKKQKMEKEMAYWKKQADNLQEQIDNTEEEQERLGRRSMFLEELIGNALTKDEENVRMEFIRKNFILPLFKN
jgi:hypothetical protein